MAIGGPFSWGGNTVSLALVEQQEQREWSEAEKNEWLAANTREVTHLVQFTVLVTAEVLIPPWETPQVAAARSAVHWGEACTEAIRACATRVLPRKVHLEHVSQKVYRDNWKVKERAQTMQL